MKNPFFKKKEVKEESKPDSKDISKDKKIPEKRENTKPKEETKELNLPENLENELKGIDSYLSELESINNNKDNTKKESSLNLSKVYTHWVYIMKNGKYVKDFGVKKKPFGNVELLVRIENINGVNRVVFAELLPEPKFDTETIFSNRVQIQKDCNRLKQIEKVLEKNIYDGNKKSYKFNIKSIRLLIQKKEVELNSIRHGKTFRYELGIRKDKMPCLIYELVNSGYKLKKEVVESNVIAEASETKRIENEMTRKEIDRQLPKNHSRDWLKIAQNLVLIIFLIVIVISAFVWISFNEERSFKQCNSRMGELFETSAQGLEKIYSKVPNTENEYLKQIVSQNNDLINLMINQSKKDPFNRPGGD